MHVATTYIANNFKERGYMLTVDLPYITIRSLRNLQQSMRKLLIERFLHSYAAIGY